MFSTRSLEISSQLRSLTLTEMIEWSPKSKYVFTFFLKSKNLTLYVFELLNTFVRTLQTKQTDSHTHRNTPLLYYTGCAKNNPLKIYLRNCSKMFHRT